MKTEVVPAHTNKNKPFSDESNLRHFRCETRTHLTFANSQEDANTSPAVPSVEHACAHVVPVDLHLAAVVLRAQHLAAHEAHGGVPRLGGLLAPGALERRHRVHEIAVVLGKVH